jgi:hypothetical protein
MAMGAFLLCGFALLSYIPGKKAIDISLWISLLIR